MPGSKFIKHSEINRLAKVDSINFIHYLQCFSVEYGLLSYFDMQTFLLRSICLILTAVQCFHPPAAQAGVITVIPPRIESQIESDGRVILKSCSVVAGMGVCAVLGPAKGLFPEEWREAGEQCREKGYGGNMFEAVGTAILTIGGLLVAGRVVAIAMTGVMMFSDGPGASANDMVMAGETVRGQITPEANFQFDVDDFVAIKNGLDFCGKRWEERKKTKCTLEQMQRKGGPLFYRPPGKNEEVNCGDSA